MKTNIYSKKNVMEIKKEKEERKYASGITLETGGKIPFKCGGILFFNN